MFLVVSRGRVAISLAWLVLIGKYASPSGRSIYTLLTTSRWCHLTLGMNRVIPARNKSFGTSISPWVIALDALGPQGRSRAGKSSRAHWDQAYAIDLKVDEREGQQVQCMRLLH